MVVTWEQANAYCEWRTDRVNEEILRSRGYLMDYKTLAGGGKGAAIGAVIGAGAGAGSVYVQGRNDLDLEAGTEVTVRATGPQG